MQVQAFVPYGSVEALLLAILPGLTRFDIPSLDPALRQPRLDCQCHELGTIVAPHVCRSAVLRNEPVSTPITRSADVVTATSSASPSRVNASITVKIRSGMPSAKASSIKS